MQPVTPGLLNMLQVDNLSCWRGERCLWQGLAFTLLPGQLLQITGANGNGKTSLLRILAGLAAARSGIITWRGVPITQRSASYQQQLCYLGHQPAVKSELTVQENLCFSLQNSSVQSRTQALAQVKLEAYRDYFGYQLSQGQRQRLGLARLLTTSTPLWILDEPLAGLDAEMITTLQTIFAEQLQRGGNIVLTTHRPLTAASFNSSSVVAMSL